MCYRIERLDSKHTWKSDVEMCLQEISITVVTLSARRLQQNSTVHSSFVCMPLLCVFTIEERNLLLASFPYHYYL
jgi:hypothetical protein